MSEYIKSESLLSAADLATYREKGCLLVPELIAEHETTELRIEAERLIAKAPVSADATNDVQGQRVEESSDYVFARDPEGNDVANRFWFPAWRSRMFLEAYGNPRVLGAAFALYGKNMVPFDESVVFKLPGHSAGFPWHQDGGFRTGDAAERGVNFGIYLTPSTIDNGALYVVPGSHAKGRLEIEALVEQHGFELPGAELAPAKAGDANLHSRSLLHGSKPNVSDTIRITWYVGFHHMDSVVDLHPPDMIARRRALIPLAVRARIDSGRFPEEVPFDLASLDADEVDSSFNVDTITRTPALQL